MHVLGFAMAVVGLLAGLFLGSGGYFVFVGGCIFWAAAYIADEIRRNR